MTSAATCCATTGSPDCSHARRAARCMIVGGAVTTSALVISLW